MATRMLRMATVSSQILMRHGKKDPPPQKRHMPIMRDGVRIEVGPLKNKKLLVYPDVDLAFIVSAIQKHGIEAGNWFYWFTTEESETDFCDNHCKGKSNLESARKWGLGRFVPYFGKDPTKMGEDADLKRVYDRVYMILPELPDEKATEEDHKKFVKELFLTMSPMLKENGVIKVFHLASWDIKALALECDLECLVEEKFDKITYPDFSPRRGGTDEKFDLTNCSVYTFRVLKKKQEPPLSETPPTGKKKDSKGKKKDSEGKQKDSKGKKKAHESATKHGLQLLLDIENVKKVVTSMDVPQVTEHKALVCAHPNRHEIIQDLYTKSNDSKRGVIHGGLVRNGVSEGRFSKVMPCEIEKIQKAFDPQALIPVYSAMPRNIEKALVDVTHPQPGEDSSPLIAAVAASIDWPQVTKYKGLVSAQPHRQEIIQDLYTTYNDPKRGIIHGGLIRAGVGEGQFKEVLLNEMEEIPKACILLEENYMPPVTFIVFQKRQHAHFFPVRHGDIASTDRSGKIRPGTVVDTKIWHPTAFDVYLCMLVAPKLSPLAHPLLSELGLARREISFSDSRFQCATLDHVAEVHSFPVIHDNVKSVMIY